MEITELQNREDEKSDQSTFYYQIGWRNVKHKQFLGAKEEGEIKGILPLFLMRSMIFGMKLVSVPFSPQLEITELRRENSHSGCRNLWLR